MSCATFWMFYVIKNQKVAIDRSIHIDYDTCLSLITQYYFMFFVFTDLYIAMYPYLSLKVTNFVSVTELLHDNKPMAYIRIHLLVMCALVCH